MKLLILFAIFVISSADDKNTKQQVFDDLEAAETVELFKKGADLTPAASAYNAYIPPSQRPSQWTQPQNTWNQPQNTWNQPQNTWNQPQNTWNPPQNTWNPPQEVKPIQPVNTYVPPATTGPQNDYVPPQHVNYPTWSTPHYHQSTTTTPVPVIKNEQYYGENGSYKYEYQIADGTHVGEEGYFTDPKSTDESIVKKGWYSFTAADGKVYTVTYWADKTGFHAFGDHLPTPPPVPAAIQAALDKEEAQKNQQNQQHQQQVYPSYQETYYTTTQAPYYPNYSNNQYYQNNPSIRPQTQPGYGK